MLVHKQTTNGQQTTASKMHELWKWLFVVNCSNRSEKRSSKYFYRIAAVISHHDKKTQELSSKRRSTWISSIRRADILTSPCFYRACSDHFVNGKYC